jgi:hypothetical protein
MLGAGPLTPRTPAMLPSGTIFPSLVRAPRCRSSAIRRRERASAWTFTCQVRPKRLKSFT